MNKQVNDSLTATVYGFYFGEQLQPRTGISASDIGQLHLQLEKVFNLDAGFLEKVKALDNVFDNDPRFDALREICFDLLMINFFAEDSKKLEDNYFDSPEWEKIEDKTLERGTELLNVFLYLKECIEEEIEPELSDYLTEFLLIEEDEFQDEYKIYEDVITHQILMDSDYSEISRVAENIRETSEMKDLFYPFMAFFYETHFFENDFQQAINSGNNKNFDASVLASLYAFTHGLKAFPKSFTNFVA